MKIDRDILLEKVTLAMNQTGPGGVWRRGLRYGLTLLTAEAEQLSQAILMKEAYLSMNAEELGILSKNRRFAECHSGQRAFVIGNGPSIARQDISWLEGEVTFAVNGFWKHSIVEVWEPTYFSLTDKLFYDGSEGSDDFFSSLRLKIQKSTFFAPINGRKIISERGLLPSERTHYLALGGTLSKSPLENVDLERVIPDPHTVLQTNILIAMYMGCNPIVIIGADHDWMANVGEDLHFYDGKTVSQQPEASENPFKSNYLIMAEYVRALWLGYVKIRAIADQKGIKIYNATDGGCLDVFPRCEFSKLRN
ncbi:hypothetical protein FRD01_16005 [Microvenator marinus]|uniref:Uncharacterized protein n=1 Tax=Microvenator marinus TaxID=2600177 RepID=A0A5B8XTU0_9DELT|nr:hypothetical protein [Microvenator marinus]QED28711.1 hypothetical protein FRD01_16005 [Microvenator marinus]